MMVLVFPRRYAGHLATECPKSAVAFGFAGGESVAHAITSKPARDADVMALPQEPSDVFPQLSAYDQRDVASVFLSERCGDLRKRCSSISHISHLLNLLFCVFTTPVLFAHCHSGSAASRPILHVLRVVAVIQMIGVDAGRDIARMAYKFLRRTKCLRI